MNVLIKNARAIVTCDGTDSVYRDADMFITDGRIVTFGKDLTNPADQVIDGKGKLVYPGLVNTHHHFFQAFVRNLITVDYPNMTLLDWLDSIYRIFRLVDSDVIYYTSLSAMADLLKHGCTCAFDHQYCYTNATGKSPVDRQMEAAKLLGIRYHAGRGANTLPPDEGSCVPVEMIETTDEFLKDCERLIRLYHDPNPQSMSQIVVAPCQPVNSYPETFRDSAIFAREHGVRLHTHLGEGETDAALARWGKRTLDWCEDLGFVGPDVWYAHFWEILPEEYTRMAKYQTGISHCPAPAVLGGCPILDIKGLLAAGVPVSLGCDGSATNDCSNLLDSLRVAYLLQTYHSKRRGGAISAYEMLKVATVGGAQALGRHDLGSLEVGKAADLFMIDGDTLELAGALHDPKNLLARTGVTGPVWLTMVNGKVVYREGQLADVDEKELSRAGEAVCDRVLRERCPAYRV